MDEYRSAIADLASECGLATDDIVAEVLGASDERISALMDRAGGDVESAAYLVVRCIESW